MPLVTAYTQALVIQAYIPVVTPIVNTIVDVISLWGWDDVDLPNGVHHTGRKNVKRLPPNFRKEPFWFVKVPDKKDAKNSFKLPMFANDDTGRRTTESDIFLIPECHLIRICNDMETLESEVERLLTIRKK